jgi:hypothetical protein
MPDVITIKDARRMLNLKRVQDENRLLKEKLGTVEDEKLLLEFTSNSTMLW